MYCAQTCVFSQRLCLDPIHFAVYELAPYIFVSLLKCLRLNCSGTCDLNDSFGEGSADTAAAVKILLECVRTIHVDRGKK